MDFLGGSAPPAKLLGGPNRGWHAVPARILGVSMAEPEKGVLIILDVTIGRLHEYFHLTGRGIK